MLSADKKPNDGDPRDLWRWVVLLLIIVCAAAIRIRLSTMPFERDEGEYAYIAQQMLKGVPPYVSAYSMKLPGIYAVYALILAVFGQTHIAIHLGLVIVNAATILVIFWLTKDLFGELAGIASAGTYAIMSLATPVLGLSANAEHFVILPALVGLLLIYRTADKRRYVRLFAAGLLFGLAFVIKQHGIFFAVFAAVYLLYCGLRHRPIKWKGLIFTQLVFMVGVITPFALVCLLYRQAGVFEKFWFWTFTYAGKYATAVPLSLAPSYFLVQFVPIFKSAMPIWSLALLGLVVIIIVRRLRPTAVFTVGLLAFSFIAICPGFYFREHYFIFLLPAVALLAGAGFAFLNNQLVGRLSSSCLWRVTVLVGAIAAGFTLYQQRAYLFYNTPVNVCRLIYGVNPFPESLKIADFIRANSDANDTIVVIGSEPQIYFYSGRRAATRYIYTYPLMETHHYAAEMQKEMIGEIKSAKPEFMVFVNIPTSWLHRPDSVQDIFKWCDSYVSSFYDTVGIIEMHPYGQITSRWNEEVIGYKPASKYWVAVLKRKR